MEHSKLIWEDVIKFEEVAGYGISGNTANNIILSWMKEVLRNNEWCMNCH